MAMSSSSGLPACLWGSHNDILHDGQSCAFHSTWGTQNAMNHYVLLVVPVRRSHSLYQHCWYWVFCQLLCYCTLCSLCGRSQQNFWQRTLLMRCPLNRNRYLTPLVLKMKEAITHNNIGPNRRRGSELDVGPLHRERRLRKDYYARGPISSIRNGIICHVHHKILLLTIDHESYEYIRRWNRYMPK